MKMVALCKCMYLHLVFCLIFTVAIAYADDPQMRHAVVCPGRINAGFILLANAGNVDDARVNMLINRLRSTNEKSRKEAMDALIKIGPPIVSRLVKVLTDKAWQGSDDCVTVGEVLGRIGITALPAVIKVLKNKRVHLEGAQIALTDMGPEVIPAVIELLRYTGNNDEKGTKDDHARYVRMVAVKVLTHITPMTESAKMGLFMALMNTVPRVQMWAAEFMVYYMRQSHWKYKIDASILIKVLGKSTDRRIRTMGKVFAEIKDKKFIVPVFLRVLKNPVDQRRMNRMMAVYRRIDIKKVLRQTLVALGEHTSKAFISALKKYDFKTQLELVILLRSVSEVSKATSPETIRRLARELLRYLDDVNSKYEEDH